MYSHLDQGGEIMCMSQSLPTLFRRASDYHRQITLTPTGGVAVETADDPNLTQVIRAHARLRHRGHARDDAGDDGPRRNDGASASLTYLYPNPMRWARSFFQTHP